MLIKSPLSTNMKFNVAGNIIISLSVMLLAVRIVDAVEIVSVGM